VRQTLAVLLCAALVAPGCASTSYRFSALQPMPGQSGDARQVADPAIIGTFARQLPAGSHVRVRVAAGRTIRGTFMTVTDGQIVVQPRTRIMEPAIRIPISEVIGIEVEQPNNVGKAIAIGVTTGAAAALGVFLLILAAVVDD
jgi:hypothetical protein